AKAGGTAQLTAVGEVVGTPAYISPEQINGTALDVRTDMFSLGVTYYELLTGVVPFAGTTMFEILKNRTKPVTLPRTRFADIPAAAEQACLGLMETDREKRPRDMAAVIELLEAVERGLD